MTFFTSLNIRKQQRSLLQLEFILLVLYIYFLLSSSYKPNRTGQSLYSNCLIVFFLYYFSFNFHHRQWSFTYYWSTSSSCYSQHRYYTFNGLLSIILINNRLTIQSIRYIWFIKHFHMSINHFIFSSRLLVVVSLVIYK
jgi:hypothetical protein